MFYNFDQNNSGGSWDVDEEKGIGYLVIIEADSEEEALRKAEEIGIYFNGVAQDIDCECCGDRWSDYCIEVNEKPIQYGEDVSNGTTDSGIPSFIHYKNGTIKKI